MSKITNDEQLNPVSYRMLYSCSYMVTVGVKGLNYFRHDIATVGGIA